jgi:hypothetical protein
VHHPEWGTRDKEENCEATLEILAKGILKLEPGTPTRRADTATQEPFTLDLVIASPTIADRTTEATIADNDLTTGSDHKTLAWEILTAADTATPAVTGLYRT